MRKPPTLAQWRARVYGFVRDVPGLSIEGYEQARRDFEARGIDFAHVPKGWRFWKWVSDRPQQLILWCGPGLVRDYLDNPDKLTAELARLEREILEAARG